MSGRIKSVSIEVLEMLSETGKDTHPNEFACILRMEKGIINEIMLLPGTIGGNNSAIMYLNMMPLDFNVVGTAHTHPSGFPVPSPQDLQFFQHFGNIHIIMAHPYSIESYAVYDFRGNKINLEVIK